MRWPPPFSSFRFRCILACAGPAWLGGVSLSLAQVAAAAAPATEPAASERSAAHASTWRIPPVDGELTGEFQVLGKPDAPRLPWRIAVRTTEDGMRVAQMAAAGPGARLEVELQLDAHGNGTWRIHEAALDLGQWSAAISPRFGADFAGLAMSGRVTLAGEGPVAAGKPGGWARMRLTDGAIDDPVHKLKLSGIALDLTMEDLAVPRSAPAQSLTWREGRYDVIPLGAGLVEFSIRGDQVQVNEASLEVFGGEIVLAAFVFSLTQPEASVIARVMNLDVAHLIPYLPKVLTEASGRVDGSITLHRTPAGLRIGSGNLALRAGHTADLHLAPQPGLLSNALPETVLKHYPGLARIETGQMPLRAETLDVSFTPDGDAQGRTAAVHIVGGPVDPRLRAPIDLNINVRGPLEQLIKFGTNTRLRFGD